MIKPDRAMGIARAVLAGGARGVELRELAEWVIERLEQLRAEADEADRLREGIERLVELLEPDTDIHRCHWLAAYDAVSDIHGRLCELLNADGPHVCPGCYAVAPERCAPGCIDAEMEEERRHAEESGDYDEGEEEDDG